MSLENPLPGTMKLGKIDVKARGGYVLAPPSVHPSGRPYTAVNPYAPIIRMESIESVLPDEILKLKEPDPTPVIRLGSELSDDLWQSALHPARLPSGESVIATILAGHTLFELFPTAQRRGRKYWTPCPLHHDTDPSLAIDEDGRYARCFAGCTPPQGYDFINFYAAMNGMTNSEAIQVLS